MVGEEGSGTRGLVEDEVWEIEVVASGRSLGQTRVKGVKEEEEEALLPVVVTGRLVVVIVVVDVVAVVGWMGATEVLVAGGEVLTAWLPFSSASRLFFLFVSCKGFLLSLSLLLLGNSEGDSGWEDDTTLADDGWVDSSTLDVFFRFRLLVLAVVVVVVFFLEADFFFLFIFGVLLFLFFER
jgi:hypothetical protein